MGRRGPAPTPTKVKLAKGETRPSRINMLEPKPRDRAPTMPKDMSDAARSVWRQVIREMHPAGVITAADSYVLRMFCEAFVRYQQAQTMYEASAPLIKTRGYLVKNPLHQVLRDNADQVRQLARELGLSPAARANLQVQQGPNAQDLDDVLGPPRLSVVAGGK